MECDYSGQGLSCLIERKKATGSSGAFNYGDAVETASKGWDGLGDQANRLESNSSALRLMGHWGDAPAVRGFGSGSVDSRP